MYSRFWVWRMIQKVPNVMPYHTTMSKFKNWNKKFTEMSRNALLKLVTLLDLFRALCISPWTLVHFSSLFEIVRVWRVTNVTPVIGLCDIWVFESLPTVGRPTFLDRDFVANHTLTKAVCQSFPTWEYTYISGSGQSQPISIQVAIHITYYTLNSSVNVILSSVALMCVCSAPLGTSYPRKQMAVSALLC